MTHYFDVSKLGGCVGIFVDPGDRVVYTGCQIHTEPEKYRHLAGPFENIDFHFWFGEESPEAEIYTVPRTELGGYDSRGGYFAAMDTLDFREAKPLYYIDREKQCWRITDDSREFVGMGPGWREKMVPSEDLEVFASYEQARERYPIQRPENDDKLLNMLKGEWEA